MTARRAFGWTQGIGLAFAVIFVSGGWLVFPAGWPRLVAAVVSVLALIAWAFSH
jgi:hypothetical protein